MCIKSFSTVLDESLRKNNKKKREHKLNAMGALPSPGAEIKCSLGLEKHVPGVIQKRGLFFSCRHIAQLVDFLHLLTMVIPSIYRALEIFSVFAFCMVL